MVLVVGVLCPVFCGVLLASPLRGVFSGSFVGSCVIQTLSWFFLVSYGRRLGVASKASPIKPKVVSQPAGSVGAAAEGQLGLYASVCDRPE